MDRRELEAVLWRATVMALGLDPEDEASQSRVRESWPSAETGSPNWRRDEDVVFLRVSPGIDSYSAIHDIGHEYDPEADQLTELVSYHRAWQFNWVCYGPGSDEDADRIRIGMLRQGVHDYLMAHGIAVRPDIPDPIRMPEPDETGEWWERSDVTAQAYERVTRRYSEDYIAVPPEINVRTDK